MLLDYFRRMWREYMVPFKSKLFLKKVHSVGLPFFISTYQPTLNYPSNKKKPLCNLLWVILIFFPEVLSSYHRQKPLHFNSPSNTNFYNRNILVCPLDFFWNSALSSFGSYILNIKLLIPCKLSSSQTNLPFLSVHTILIIVGDLYKNQLHIF